MSRLESYIRRMQAQRDFLNAVAPAVRRLPGHILEIGLGNGRTYDHLRQLFPDRAIFAYDFAVIAHPACVPPPDRLFLGDARDTLLRSARSMGGLAALVHSDLGGNDPDEIVANAAWLGSRIDALLAPGGVVIVNQALSVPGWRRLAPPPGIDPQRYFGYCAGESSLARADSSEQHQAGNEAGHVRH